MIEDVGEAADLLRTVYQRTSGADGYASIEVSPFLANDTAATVEAGRRIWGRLKRPNVMIKVPATVAGLAAIESLIADGINVNVTLIFSVARYEQVIDAYLKGLEKRLSVGKSIADVASVASFFVSRVDTITEKVLSQLVTQGKVEIKRQEYFVGKLGVANSKLAYELFNTEIGTSRFAKIKAAGGRAQRPLWASTSVKNPALSPLLYVEQLAGESTVNTVPPATLKEIMSAATIQASLKDNLDGASSLLTEFEAITALAPLLEQLEREGVKAFSDSYQELLDSIAHKVRAVAAA
jgi:transaldolase